MYHTWFYDDFKIPPSHKLAKIYNKVLKKVKNKFQAFSGQVNYIVGIVEVLYMNTLYISFFLYGGFVMDV